MIDSLLTLPLLFFAVDAAPGAAAPVTPSPLGRAVESAQPEQSAMGRFWFPPEASTGAAQVDWVFNFITWICIFFFVLICALMLYFMVKYRQRGHEGASSQVTHNTPLELTWTIIPLILVIAIFYVGMAGYVDLRQSPGDSYTINVVGQQWSWQLNYPDGTSLTNELVVPVGRPVRLLMSSQDVLHAFYIPAFRVKQDVVPGKYSTIWFQATQEGEFPFYCAEYCGKDHSQMVGKVTILSPEGFDRRLQEERDYYKTLPDDALARYAAEKLYPRCASCHTLDGRSSTGPTWLGLWSKLKSGGEIFTDGSSLADHMGPGKDYETPEDYIRESILNPQKRIVETYTGAMPTFQGSLKERQLTAIVYFIQALDKKGSPEYDALVDAQGKIKPAPKPAAADAPAAK